jgi:hypothetical protein
VPVEAASALVSVDDITAAGSGSGERHIAMNVCDCVSTLLVVRNFLNCELLFFLKMLTWGH